MKFSEKILDITPRHKFPTMVKNKLRSFRVVTQKLREDASRISDPTKNRHTNLLLLTLNAGFRTLVIERIQEACSENEWRGAEMVFLNLNLTLSGAEFRPGCRIGKGAIIRHPNGIVIGGKVVIGDYVVLQNGVTMGEKYVDHRSVGFYPTIGSNVTIGAYAVIVGGIHVGDGSTIGALTFVNKNVPAESTVVSHMGNAKECTLRHQI